MSTFEDFNKESPIEISSDRSFGVVFAVFFLILGLIPLIKGAPIRYWALITSVLFLSVAIIKASLLHPLNLIWCKLGILMGKIVTPIVLCLLFYAVLTPLALLMRLSGKDPLRLKVEPQAKTYWIARTPPGPAPETMTNQF